MSTWARSASRARRWLPTGSLGSCSGWPGERRRTARRRAGRRRDADVRDVVRGLARSRVAGARGAGGAVRPPAARVPVAGPALRTAVDRRRRGAPWHEAASRSYGNGALCRAAAVGIVRAGDARSIGEAASIDAAVTHASRRATASSAALAGMIAAARAARSRRPLPLTSSPGVVASVGHDKVRASLELALASRGVPAADVVEPDGRLAPRHVDARVGVVVRARVRRPGRGDRHRGGGQRPRRHRRRRHRRAGRGDPQRLLTPGALRRGVGRCERLPAAR